MFTPGIGYLATVGTPEALRSSQLHDEEEALKERQMDVNEQAETRAGKMNDEWVANQKQARQQVEVNAKGSVEAYGVLGPDAVAPTKAPASGGGDGTAAPVAKGGSAPVPVTPAPVPTPSEVAQAATPPPSILDNNLPEPVGSMGQHIEQQEDGSWRDPLTGSPESPLIIGPGKSGFAPPARHGGNESGGDARVKTPNGYGAGSPTTGSGAAPRSGPSVSVDTGAGGTLSPGDVTKMMQGKTTVFPNQGQGYIDLANTLKEKAGATQGRLDDALKSIDQQYSNDPTMAAFMKANVIGKVSPMISQMQANAAQAQQQGMLVDHMHKGSVLAENMIGHLLSGNVIDDKFIKNNKGLIDELGFNPSIMAGMHLEKKDPTSKGWIVNAGGFIIPPKAIMLVANPALPWEDRAKGWDAMISMYKDQMKAKSDLTTAAMGDPLRFVKGSMELNDKLNIQYADADMKYKTLLAKAMWGGDVQTTDPKTGKVITIALDKKYLVNSQMVNGKSVDTPVDDWVANMGALGPDNKPKNPNAYLFYNQEIKPLLDVRQRLSSNSAFVVHGAKNSVNAMEPGQIEQLGPLKAYFAAMTKSDAEGMSRYNSEKAQWEKKPENSNKPFPWTLEHYGVKEPGK